MLQTRKIGTIDGSKKKYNVFTANDYRQLRDVWIDDEWYVRFYKWIFGVSNPQLAPAYT